MSDIKLFDLRNQTVTELVGQSVNLEKALQTLLENNLESFLGIQYLDTEYSTGKQHGGRIDTLGIDENGCPVIIEYKRSLNENIINQGLFYLDWLLDHKADFELLVMKKLGKEKADGVEWSNPRLICIAGDFTKFDEYAIKQINRNIELIRYKKYGDDFLILELVNAVTATTSSLDSDTSSKTKQQYKTILEYLEQSPAKIKNLYEDLKAFALSLGDDVQEKTLKYYIAFKRIKNFACIEIHSQSACILVFLKVDPDTIDLKALGKDFARDMREIGHYGTGDLEVKLRSTEDLEKAKPLIIKSYEIS